MDFKVSLANDLLSSILFSKWSHLNSLKQGQILNIFTKEIQYADAILALANLVKNNRKLKQISHSKKITIHTIQSNSLLHIAKALRLLAKKNSMVPLIPEKYQKNTPKDHP